MPEPRWVTFVAPQQAKKGCRMRVDEGSPVLTVEARVFCGAPRREHIIWAEGGGITTQFARRHRWQIEVWI
jgi:hypothetical protein